ncbi:hypothetical protein SBA6_180018 [Candidatus Sulfopaludibacter sp. SbA6]|nr:hypothetical protein SBA6_180018 [Candidatus Sulfopaludibacter sp. SbA6]
MSKRSTLWFKADGRRSIAWGLPTAIPGEKQPFAPPMRITPGRRRSRGRPMAQNTFPVNH